MTRKMMPKMWSLKGLTQSARCYSTGLSDKLILIEESRGLRKILLNDNRTRNAFSLKLMQDLIDGIQLRRSDPGLRCIAIGAVPGKVFSAGHNLKELTMDQGLEKQKQVFAKCTELMMTIRNSEVPVFAHVNGLAAAAGCQMVAACDFAFATKNSSFSTPGASFGVFCSTPGIDVARKVGKSMAAYMVLTGANIDAEQALQSGLIVKVVPDQQALDNAVEEAYINFESKSRAIIKLGRQFFYKQIEMLYSEALREGSNTMIDNLSYKDCQNALDSFKQKNKPTWEHSDDRV